MDTPTRTPSFDNDLLQRARAGEFAAFQQIVEQLQPRVYGVAFRIVQQRQDAEDVTQQTFLSLIEHFGEFRKESSLATWVLKIATNHALKLLRKKRGLPTATLASSSANEGYDDVPHPEFIAPWTLTPEQIAEQGELRAEIDRALAELDEKYRCVFVLRDIEGLSIKEAAEALALTEGTVKVRLLRARLALRERLTRRFGDPQRSLRPDHDHAQ